MNQLKNDSAIILCHSIIKCPLISWCVLLHILNISEKKSWVHILMLIKLYKHFYGRTLSVDNLFFCWLSFIINSFHCDFMSHSSVCCNSDLAHKTADKTVIYQNRKHSILDSTNLWTVDKYTARTIDCKKDECHNIHEITVDILHWLRHLAPECAQ